MNGDIRLLRRLALLYGVQTAYYDVSRHRQVAPAEALLAMLRSLGAPLQDLRDAPSAWRERRQRQWQRILEPVSIAWDGAPLVQVRLPSAIADANLSCRLQMETGEHQDWRWRGADLRVLDGAEAEGARYSVRQLTLSLSLPAGYHRLTVEVMGRREEALIISAPLRAYTPAEKPAKRMWGAFLPLYALHTQRSWGSGDFSDLEALLSWVGEMGGGVVATLPLLAAFQGETSDPSPYIPASRLLWNEFYVDVNRVPELSGCPSAQAMLASSSFQGQMEALRSSPLVDYHKGMALKRQVLSEMCRCLFARPSARLESLRRFAEANPVVEDYARFRAVGEKQHCSWRSWPHSLRDGALKEGDYDEEDRRYHLYAQWLAHQQVAGLSAKAKEKGVQLYLDLPVGVHADGYDTWRWRDVFIPDVSIGAPPDVVFTRGQDWESPTLHPEKIREQGYQYTIAYLRHHLRHAGILRVDHLMGLHRLFCIPKGMEASQGVYLRYRPEEFYAILSLESHRHRAVIVGEDLGTVPSYVRPAMKRHGLHRMYVLYYELAASPRRPPPVPRDSVASLNTHDMPPFAAFWQGQDVEERLKLGLVDKASAEKERQASRRMRKALTAFLREWGWPKGSKADTAAVLQAFLALLAASRARLLLVNMEDLWLETQPQNVPGIKREYPSWRRKARYGLEEFCRMPQVIDTLRMIDGLRQKGVQRDNKKEKSW